MRYCGMCGTPLTAACAECGFANPLAYRFCGMCGKLLLEAVQSPTELQFLPAASEAEALPPAAPAALDGERRVITVILTDLTNSTTLLESLGTEGWVELMNRILHILEAEINRFGGEISQFRGDGLVAFFGAASAHEDDPERAILAALSMQRAFKLYVQELSQSQALDLQMRVGVNTGEVIVASSGDRRNWEEAAMGMAVTIAARMETAAEPGTVLVSENTYHLLESQFDWRALGEISIKGVSQPIAVYRPEAHILDAKNLLGGTMLPETLPIIGREAEFNTLKECVRGLFNGGGHIAVLSGDKGSGKTFLLNEVRRYFARLDSLLNETRAASPGGASSLIWVGGRCRSYNQSWPYSMWQDFFRDWLGARPEDSKEQMRDYLHRQAWELWGDLLEENYPYLATFLGLPLEEAFTEKIRHLDGESLRQRFFLAVYSWVEAASRRGPLVLSFSDMQWADDSSIALLKFCLPICDNESLLWLLSFRLEHGAPIWDFHHYLWANFHHRITDVPLQPLDELQSGGLIDNLIGSQTLPQETRDLIIHNAEGNPYYILELIRALITDGVLIRHSDGGPWKVSRTVTTLDIPESLQLLLLSRIDRLSTQERKVLQVAAVVGPVFWLNLVQAMLEDAQTLKIDLAALQRAQLILENGRIPELGMQYIFKSPLIRDAAYESLLSAYRVAFHLKVAEYLEDSISADILDGYDGLLAYHYHGAGNPNKELFYTSLAAERARKIYANAEALQHYSRAIELLDDLQQKKGNSKEENRCIQTQRFEILNGRREIYFRLGQFDSAGADTQALLPLARQMADDPVWLIDALLAQTDYLEDNREELIPGLQMAEEALALAQQINDLHREMRSLVRIANYHFALKDPASMEQAERALELARQLGDLKTEVNLLLGIGRTYGMDDLHRSRGYMEAALSRSEKLNDKATEMMLLTALGQQYEREGDYHRQLTEFEQKRLRLSREIGNRVEEGQALMFCGQIQALYLGDYAGGLELENQALHIWEPINLRLFPLIRIAQIQAAQGQCTEALSTLELAEPLAGKVVLDIGRAGFDLVKIIVYNALGDEHYLRLALDLASQTQQMVADQLVSRQYHMTAACKAAQAHLHLARLLAGGVEYASESQAHLTRALEASQNALNLYHQFGFVQVVECTSEEIFYRHSQALAVNDRIEEAAEFLLKANNEMIRKYDLIPSDSPFRQTYLENIQLHQDIRAAFSAKMPE
jgi:predicted ATPase/class 3 adenylate cyclase